MAYAGIGLYLYAVSGIKNPPKDMPWVDLLMKLLFPVMPDVLHVVIFHDVDELFHSKPSVSGDLQGEHWKMTLFKFDEKFQFSTNGVIPS